MAQPKAIGVGRVRAPAAHCPACGRTLAPRARGDAVYCCAACRARHWRWTQLSRSRIKTIRSGDATQARCPECGTSWVVGLERRSTAVYCSHRCRTRGWRHKRSV